MIFHAWEFATHQEGIVMCLSMVAYIYVNMRGQKDLITMKRGSTRDVWYKIIQNWRSIAGKCDYYRLCPIKDLNIKCLLTII